MNRIWRSVKDMLSKGSATPKPSLVPGVVEPLAVSLVVLFGPPCYRNGSISKTEVGIKGLLSPMAGPAPTLTADKRCLCPPSRSTAPYFHQRASCVDDVVSIPAR